MCGIAGILTRDGGFDPAVLQRMNDLLAHRGPDGDGFMLATGPWDGLHCSFERRAAAGASRRPVRVGLAHRRLAILDLSDAGLQPMQTRDARNWIVFNGEIYNHIELRATLESLGYRFSSRTDTEVLLNAYAAWGDACLDRLEGMFAFALWDNAARRLFCARDRLGIKPLYYTIAPGYFAFASEIKAFTALPGWTARANDDAIVGFLMHANCDYGERTVFRDVVALPPAHALDVGAGAPHVSVRRYWSPQPSGETPGRDEDRVEELRQALTRTVRKHLISDVRVGSCLSGGLDSSTVVGVMGRIQRDEPEAARAMGDRLSTFTSCYANRAFDEREYAQCIADSVGSQTHLVFPAADDFWNDFERMAWHQDMPFGALSYYAQWRVMRAAHEAGVKVLLDGQGGDEVFGGYAKFRYAYIASLARDRRFGAAAGELGALIRQGDRYLLDLRNGYRYLPPAVRRLLNVDSVLKRVLIPARVRAAADESTPATRWWRHARASRHARSAGPTLMQQIQIDDIVTDTLPQLLRMEDRSSMAFSIEARVPLLDHKVVEYGLSLPDHLKISRGWSKFAVRQAMRGIVPDFVRLRRTKLGFAAPDRAWLMRDLRANVSRLLRTDLRCRRYIDADALGRWYHSSEAARANTESYLGLFRILSLEMWMRAFNVS